jgi:RNA polymerase sigma factor (sigma-70 family)
VPPNIAPQHQKDLLFVDRVLNGCDDAVRCLRSRYQTSIIGTLCGRGASKTEAEDLVADLWSDCFGARDASGSILRQYQGRCALSSWLITIATHRLIDLKRRQGFRGDLVQETGGKIHSFDSLPGPAHGAGEPALSALLLRAIRCALMSCDAEAVLMLKLVHLHRISQRELARMWQWHESTVSRTLEVARKQIKEVALEEVKRIDPWLELNWSDFSELCRCSPDLLSAVENDNSLQRSVLRQSNR